MKKKILATSWHPGGTNALIPVIKRLKKEGMTIVTVGYQYSEDIFKSSGIPCNTIRYYGLNDVSIKSMDEILEKEQPDLVFTGTSVQDENNRDVIEQTLTYSARERGIKSLAVLDF